MNQRSLVFIIIYQDGSVFVVEGSKLHQKRVSDATPSRIKCNMHWIPPSREFENESTQPCSRASANKKEKFLKNRQRIQILIFMLVRKRGLEISTSSCCQKKCQIIHKCSSESTGRNMVAWMWKQNRKHHRFFHHVWQMFNLGLLHFPSISSVPLLLWAC